MRKRSLVEDTAVRKVSRVCLTLRRCLGTPGVVVKTIGEKRREGPRSPVLPDVAAHFHVGVAAAAPARRALRGSGPDNV